MAKAPKILGTDSLRNAFPKLNMMVDMVNLFQEQIDEIVVEGDSSPAIAQALANTPYKSLREKHEAIDAELAAMPKKEDIQQLSLSFKESYATLADLQAAYPNGNNSNHVVLSDNMIYTYKNGWISTGIQGVGTGLADGTVTDPKVAIGAVSLNKRTVDILPKFPEGYSTTHYSFAAGSVSTPSNYGAANSLNGINYRHDTELIEVESNSRLKFEISADSVFKIAVQEFDSEKKGIVDRGYQTGNTVLSLGQTTRFIRLIVAKKDNSFFPITDIADIKASVELSVSKSANHHKYDEKRNKIKHLIKLAGNENLVSMTADFWEIADLTGTIGATLNSMYSTGSGVNNRARIKSNRVVSTKGFKRLFAIIPASYFLDLYFFNANDVLCGIAYLNGSNAPDTSIYIPDGSVRFSARIYKFGTPALTMRELESLELMISFVDHPTFKYSQDEATVKIQKLLYGSNQATVIKKNFSDKVRYIGHAGTAAYAPENTVESVKMASLMGMWGAECDLGITKDGKLVLMHDLTLERTTDGTGNVSNFTLEEIKELNVDVGLKQFTNVKVPTLEEYLIACKQYGLVPVIEVKNNGHTTGMVDALMPILKRYNVLESCLLISFGKETLNYIRSLNETVHLSYLLTANTPITQADITYATQLGNASLNVHGTNSITKEMVDNCHNAGISVLAWTINDRTLADYLISIGVDMLTTDSLVNPNRNKKKFTMFISTSDKGENWTVSSSQFSETGIAVKTDNYTVAVTLNELLKSAVSQFEIPITAQNNTYFANQVVTPVVFKENDGMIRMQLLKGGALTTFSNLPGDNLKICLSIEI